MVNLVELMPIHFIQRLIPPRVVGRLARGRISIGGRREIPAKEMPRRAMTFQRLHAACRRATLRESVGLSDGWRPNGRSNLLGFRTIAAHQPRTYSGRLLLSFWD